MPIGLWSYVTASHARVLGRAVLAALLAALLAACTVATDSPRDRDAGGPRLARVSFDAASRGLPIHGIWKSTPAVADVNGDGFPDVIALPRLGHGVRVWLGNADGGWVEASRGLEVTGSCGGGVAVADVNRDGHRDLVVADHCDGVFVYLGDGRGGWTAVVKELNPAIARERPMPDTEDNPFVGAEDVAVGDVDGDGFLDLVVVASNMGGFTVFLGDGSGTAWTEVTVPDGLPSGTDAEPDDEEQAGWANRVLLADVDGDGHLDVVATYHSGPRVWRGNGAARWESFSRGLPSSQAGGVYRALALGDVNSDGRLDVVTTNMLEGIEIYVQTAESTWRRVSSAALGPLTGGATAVALGDLNGDGHLDLVVGGRRTGQESFGLFVFLGNGDAQWREVDTALPSHGYPFVWGLTLGDTNRDGARDIVVATGFVAEPHRALRSRAVAPRALAASGRPSDAHLQVWVNARHRP